MRARRVGHADASSDIARGLRRRQRNTERELGAEPGRQAERLRGLGEADDAVQPVVVGECERGQAKAHRFFGKFLRARRAIEEAERRVRMQLGIRHDQTTWWL